MGRVDELRHILRKDEYDEEERINNILTEDAKLFHESVTKNIYEQQAPLRKMKNKCKFMKEVICECMCNLYESALIIDDVEKYSKTLRDACRTQCLSIMEECTVDTDLINLFENASPYVKGMLVLAEEAYADKSEDEIKAFDDKILLNKDDYNLIQKFENSEGKDVYVTDLQDRIVDVYKAEEKLGEEQKDKVQAIVDELAKMKSTGAEEDRKTAITEAIEHGTSIFNTTPKTIFNSIFINKSKQFLQETASADLSENGDKILAETIAIYTLLETIHALGFHTYSKEEQRQLKMDFFTAN